MTESTSIFHVLKLYTGETWFLFFLLAAVVYLLYRSDKENRRNILIIIIGAIILIFNNISMRVVGAVVGSETYYRFLWMIPLVPILGYVVVDLFVRQKTKIARGAVIVAAGVLLVLGGESCLAGDGMEMPKSVHYVDPEIRVMAHLIEQDKERNYPYVAAPVEIAIPIRLENASIRNYIKRKTYLKDGNLKSKKAKWVRQKRLYRVVNGEQIDIKKLKKAVKNGKIDYMIIANRYRMDDYMIEAGYEILANTGNYTIYRC